MKVLLIIGCRRGGTTLLASLLGAHSQINMINDAYGNEVLSLIGKQYQGVKLAYPHIKFNKRYSHLYRLFYYKTTIIRIWIRKHLNITIDAPIGSKYSINDYFKMKESKIIFIHRNKLSNVQSMINRSLISKRKAENNWKCFNARSWDEFRFNSTHLSYEDLTKEPEKTLKIICYFLKIQFESQMLDAAGLNNTYSNSIINNEK